MTLSEDQKQTVKNALAEIFDVDPSELREETRFREDLGAESLMAIEVLVEVERKFNVTIKQELLPRMSTLAGVYQVLSEVLAANAAQA